MLLTVTKGFLFEREGKDAVYGEEGENWSVANVKEVPEVERTCCYISVHFPISTEPAVKEAE